MNQTIQAHNRYVFQIISDAFCVAFHSAIDVLKVASEAQRALQNESWIHAPIKVRVGIHAGTAQMTVYNNTRAIQYQLNVSCLQGMDDLITSVQPIPAADMHKILDYAKRLLGASFFTPEPP